MGAAVDYSYRYVGESGLEDSSGWPRIYLATSGGAEANPYFFQGKLRHPRLTADLMLAVARVARSRYHMPAAMLARILAAADPVVTCTDTRIRFESFSACCGVYARVDLTEEGFEGDLLGRGTTNVDFNPPMRAALSKIRTGEEVGLSVGTDEVRVDTESGGATERKVALPARWLKGFVEVQAHQARMEPRFEISGSEVRRFLRSLPKGVTRGPAYVVSAGRGLRLSQVRTREAVHVGGVERLRILEDVAAEAKALRVFSQTDGEASGWELVFGNSRFHLVLSPELWRGFSGEGQVLERLAGRGSDEAVAKARAALSWHPHVDMTDLQSRTGLDAPDLDRALAALGARGLVGYDLHEGRYFHRELPFDLAMVEKLQPRLQAARKLIDGGEIKITTRSEELVEAWVPGSGVKQRVRLAGDGAKCTCTWYAKHRGERGPCKHVLAVQILVEGDDS
jgi:hypothetical protein